MRGPLEGHAQLWPQLTRQSASLLSSRLRMLALLSGLVLSAAFGCTGPRPAPTAVLSGGMRIAVLPFDNLSGGKAPLKEMRQQLLKNMGKYGMPTVSEEQIEAMLAKYRIRYTGGVDPQVAEAMRKELSAATILITTVELCDESAVPKIALLCRLVSTEEKPRILWMDSAGLSGDDAPGLLNLGFIREPYLLREKAIRQLTDSLAAYLADRNGEAHDPIRKRFAPKVHYQARLQTGKKYRIAVLPFHNETERRSAGEILSLHFVRQLVPKKRVEIIEPGTIRQKLINLRMVMSEGVSIPDIEIIGEFLEADMILTGRCLQYEDYKGSSGVPKVMFSTLMIERQTRKMVWSSASYNEGDNGVLFFDRGRLNTANALASHMIWAVADMMVK